jgi:homoserine O-acetyltransferase
MKKLVFCALCALLLPFLAAAHGPNDPAHQSHCVGDFKLESGEAIRDFCISYVTHGTLNANKSNAVLMVTALGGNHHRIDYLIGPGRALDPARYFIIATDAIGNGLTTSPSTSKTQPRMQFPKFNMRDMVNSTHRLVTEKFGIRKLVAVAGASMGGMQGLQWAVSYPDMMHSVVALIPLARTPAWSTGITEMLRQTIMTDPDYKGGQYSSQPERAMRLWGGWLSGTIVRTPQYHEALFPNNMDVIPFLKGAQESNWKRIDANDWIYQSWAYDAHNVGTTPGHGGDYKKALRSIKAKVLIMAGSGDLLNPEYEAKEAAGYITDVRYVALNEARPMGHVSAAGISARENELQNAEIGAFLEAVTQRGKLLQ